jgi:hypothetical protein
MIEDDSFWETTCQAGVYRHETIDILVIASENNDELLREFWIRETSNDLVHGFLRKMAFG